MTAPNQPICHACREPLASLPCPPCGGVGTYTSVEDDAREIGGVRFEAAACEECGGGGVRRKCLACSEENQ